MPKSSPSETPARNNKKPYRCPSAAIPFPHASPRLQGLPPPPSIADALAREDLPPYRLLELEKELKVHNVQQELVTYDTDMGKWVTWARPVIEYKNGTQKVAATSGWSSIKDFKPPSCPHSANPFRTDTETRMDLRQQRVNGAMTYSFQSKGHKCRFIAKIPALVSMRKYILHGATQAQHGEESDTDVSDREYDHFGFDPSPSSSQTSQASLASTKSADDVASYLKDISPSPSLTRSLPRPSFGTRTPKSFFSKEIADMRAKPDLPFMKRLYKSHQNGDFEDDISSHPVAGGEVPRQLLPYEPNSGNTRTSQHLKFFTTTVGYALRELNSTAGISEEAFDIVVDQVQLCKGCHCLFSIDGYGDHLDQEDRCQNAPEFRKVKRNLHGVDAVPAIPMRTYPHDTIIPETIEFQETHIGKVLLEFNSRLGVPQDTWALAITSCVRCSTCKLIRTFHGDAGHRDGRGVCIDVGERGAALTPVCAGTGDGLEMVLWRPGSEGERSA